MKRTFLFLLFALLACAGSLRAQTFNDTVNVGGYNKPIAPTYSVVPDGNGGWKAASSSGGSSGGGAVADVPVASQSLSMTTVGNALTFTVPAGMGTLETLIQGLGASGGAVGFKASAVAGGPYSTFAAQGGSPLSDVTSFATDGSWTINTAGHVQIQLVVLTAGTGSITVAGNYSASIRNINTRVVSPPGTASTDPADATVNTTSATVLTLTSASKEALVRNTGTTPVRLGFGAAAVATAGFYLAPGDAWSMNSTNLRTGIVTAITASGTSTLALHEGH